MDTQTSRAVTIVDDGEFYIELNGNYPSREAPGFLQRRCYFGVTTPDGYECVGSFNRCAQGRWRASIDAAYDEATDSDSREVGVYATRLGAIAALWGNRHDAYCRHREC